MGGICSSDKKLLLVKKHSQTSEQQKLLRSNPRVSNQEQDEHFQEYAMASLEKVQGQEQKQVKGKRLRSMQQSALTPQIEESSLLDQDETELKLIIISSQSRLRAQHRESVIKNRSVSKKKIQLISKDTQKTDDYFSPSKSTQNDRFKNRSTIKDESLQKNLQEKAAVKINLAKDHLSVQRDFYWDKFQTELELAIPEKSLVNDIFQMMKMFFSHIEASIVYWTKFWLLSSNVNKDVIIIYQSNLGELRKIRIIYTKNIEIVSLIIDNYYYFYELGILFVTPKIASKTKDLIRIYEYNFRINKKWLNFYVFSEQEYQEFSLEQVMKSQGQLITFDTALLKDLILFLLRILNTMHSGGYIHGGIKQSNIYLYFNQEGKIMFKLDISFDTINFSRRNLKNKDIRLSEIYDIEDIAFLIFSLQMKENARAHLKFKLMEFSGVSYCDNFQAMLKESQYVSCALKCFLLLLSRDSQMEYDLRTADLYMMFQSLSQKNYQQNGHFTVKKKSRKRSQLLWRIIPKHSLLILYTITATRTFKSITRLRLVTHQNKHIIIKSVSDDGEGTLYILYEEAAQLHIGSLDMKKKVLNDCIEDTAELFILVMKQIIAQIGDTNMQMIDRSKKRDRLDSSGTQYSLQINTQSPLNSTGHDLFRFNTTQKEQNTQIKQNISGAFYDRVYFTSENIQRLFALIDIDYKGYLTKENIGQFLSRTGESMDDTLIKQLLAYQGSQPNITGLSEMLDFFFVTKQLSLIEFQEIFNYFSKKFKPVCRVQLTIVESNNVPCSSITYYDKFIFMIFQSHIRVMQLPTLVIKKNFQISQALIQTKILFNDEQFIVHGLGKDKVLHIYIFDYNFELLNVIDSNITVFGDYVLTYSKQASNYVLLYTGECKFFVINDKQVEIIFSAQIEQSVEITQFMNIFMEDQTILFIDESQSLCRIWTIIDIQLFVVCKSQIMKILNDFGRCDTKIRLGTSQKNKKTFHLTSSHDPIGKYTVLSLIYPQSGTNIAPLAQFRILKVQNPQFGPMNLILLQRSVHGEFESFDDCYSICRYLDSKGILKDFFLTYEFDSRVRLNYVFTEGDQFPTLKQNDWLIWSYMKKSLKSLLGLKLNGILIQEMHPDNIMISHRNSKTQIQFMSQMYKVNIASVFTDKAVPIQGCLEFMEPKILQGTLQQQYQNQLLLNPNKSNVYSLGLIFLRTISQQSRKGTNDLSVYVMELNQILSTLSTSPYVRSIIEEMLKDNEEQRMDYQQLLIKMKFIEQTNYHDIYFLGTSKQTQLDSIKFGRKSSDTQSYGFHFVFVPQHRRIDLSIINANSFVIHKVISGIMSVGENQQIDLIGIYRDGMTYAEGNYRNITLLVKIKDLDLMSVQLKLFFYRVSILTDDQIISMGFKDIHSVGSKQAISVYSKQLLNASIKEVHDVSVRVFQSLEIVPIEKEENIMDDNGKEELQNLLNQEILNFNDFAQDDNEIENENYNQNQHQDLVPNDQQQNNDEEKINNINAIEVNNDEKDKYEDKDEDEVEDENDNEIEFVNIKNESDTLINREQIQHITKIYDDPFTKLKLQIPSEYRDNPYSVRCRDLLIPAYEIQDFENIQTILVDQIFYLLGGQFNLLSSYHSNLECYQYNLKKQSCKKLGQLDQPIGDSSVIDVGLNLYLFERNITNSHFKVKIICKQPFSQRDARIKLKNPQKKAPNYIEVFKLSNMIACIYSLQEEDAWLLNLETLNTIHLDVTKTNQQLSAKLFKKCFWVSDSTDNSLTLIYTNGQQFYIKVLLVDIQKCSIKIQGKLI